MGGAVNMDPKLTEMYPAIYMAMIETADIVAQRYNVSREYQDEYSYTSQMRMAAAQENGLFEDEIVPMETKMKLVDRETKEETMVPTRSTATSATVRRRRSRAWPSCSRCAARATSSRPATPASCPTAPPPWC